MEYVKEFFKKTGWISIIESLIFALIGIILIINPEGTVKVISYVLGGIFIAIGIYKIYTYITKKTSGDLYNYNIIYGIMAIVIGIIMICFSATIGSLFRIIIGVWIVYSALLRLSSSIQLRHVETKMWIFTLILSILMLICGIYVIANAGAIVATIGIFILIYSIIDIIENIIFLKNLNNV